MAEESGHVAELLSDYIAMTLDVSKRAEVETHLQACAECDERYKQLVRERVPSLSHSETAKDSSETPVETNIQSEPTSDTPPGEVQTDMPQTPGTEEHPTELPSNDVIPPSSEDVPLEVAATTEGDANPEPSVETTEGEPVAATEGEVPVAEPEVPTTTKRRLLQNPRALAMLAVLGLIVALPFVFHRSEPKQPVMPPAPPAPETPATPPPTDIPVAAPSPAPETISAPPPATEPAKSGLEFEELRDMVNSAGGTPRAKKAKRSTKAVPAESPKAIAPAESPAPPVAGSSENRQETAPALSPQGMTTETPKPVQAAHTTPLPAALPEAFIGSTGLPEWKGRVSAIKSFRTVIVETPQEWKRLWQEHMGGPLREALPKVDFEQYSVIGVFGGSRKGGSTVELTQTDEVMPPAMIVYYKETEGNGSTTVQPYHLWVIFKTSLPIRFKKEG
jgi:hypothetical protein